jgi:hypothetical protein
MDKLEIITNGHKRPLATLSELPEKARKDFNYVSPESDDYPRFVRYKGSWYDIGDVEAILPTQQPADWPFAAWHGRQSETYFSGILFRYVYNYDPDFVVVGRYYV